MRRGFSSFCREKHKVPVGVVRRPETNLTIIRSSLWVSFRIQEPSLVGCVNGCCVDAKFQTYFTARVIEEEMFGVDNLGWISAKSTLEASRRTEFLILQTGMTAYGKAFYRNQSDLVTNLAAKLEALRDEYMRYAVDKCSSVLREYHSAVETITDILLDKGEIKAEEIWDIYKRVPRIPQPAVNAVDEYGALVYAGRWGIHGITLPGRVTFSPGNVGFSTFGAPRPMETQRVNDETWELIDNIWDKRVQEIKAEASAEVEEDKERPQLLMASHFL